MSKVQRAKTLLAQVDDATERLLTYQVRLIQLAAGQSRALPVVADHTAEVAACAAAMVKAVEDLLVVSRTLKEAWVLGQVHQENPEIDNKEVVLRRRRAEALVDQIHQLN